MKSEKKKKKSQIGVYISQTQIGKTSKISNQKSRCLHTDIKAAQPSTMFQPVLTSLATIHQVPDADLV